MCGRVFVHRKYVVSHDGPIVRGRLVTRLHNMPRFFLAERKFPPHRRRTRLSQSTCFTRLYNTPRLTRTLLISHTTCTYCYIHFHIQRASTIRRPCENVVKADSWASRRVVSRLASRRRRIIELYYEITNASTFLCGALFN